MKKNEYNLIYDYLFHDLARYEEAEAADLSKIRFCRSDAVDCFELARSKDNTYMFLKFAKDIMILLHMVEDNEDFDYKYAEFKEQLLKERRRGHF